MPRPDEKSYAISKVLVWEAWRQVKANKGAPGVDGQERDAFEKDLEGNLYKVWNRMSSGTWFPPPVRAVEIPQAAQRPIHLLGELDQRTPLRLQMSRPTPNSPAEIATPEEFPATARTPARR